MSHVRVVDAQAMSWENGLDVLARMAPAWGENLGPSAGLEGLLRPYNQKTLRHDTETTRRLDLVRIEGGYEDLTNAYHGTVEECLVLTGSLDLDGEGHFVAGDYFWRPPGFVHAARSDEGFTALLGVQGNDPAEGSGHASRVIRPDEEAGTNALHPDDADRALGPRGWVRQQPTGLLPWLPGAVYARTQGAFAGMGLEQLAIRVLSQNAFSGGQTIQVRAEPGWAQSGHAETSHDSEFVVLDGALLLGTEEVGPMTCVHVPAGTLQAPWSAPDGCLLYAKVDGLWDRVIRP